jgi:hypothetical protein
MLSDDYMVIHVGYNCSWDSSHLPGCDIQHWFICSNFTAKTSTPSELEKMSKNGFSITLNFSLAITFFFCTLIQYLLPFVCLPYISGLWRTIKGFFRRNNRRIIPMLEIRMAHTQQQQKSRI